MDTIWIGWVKTPGQGWRAVVQAADLDTAWRLTLDHKTGGPTDRAVLPQGVTPAGPRGQQRG